MLIGVGALGVAACNCQAGTSVLLSEPPTEQFKLFDSEFQIDLGGSYIYSGDYAVETGVNYFFDENWGVGLDAQWYANSDALADFDVLVSGIYRFPIEEFRIAPYAHAGLGYVWGVSNEWSYQAGLGIDYRIGDRLGVYAEWRYRYTPVTSVDKNAYNNIWAVGARLTF